MPDTAKMKQAKAHLKYDRKTGEVPVFQYLARYRIREGGCRILYDIDVSL